MDAQGKDWDTFESIGSENIMVSPKTMHILE